jgi:hypothetical protein
MMCKHENFVCDCDVHRLEDVGRFTMDVRVKCVDCGKPFRFLGLSAGCDVNGAAVSVDGCEARLAIAPDGEVIPELDGTPHGFTVRRTR